MNQLLVFGVSQVARPDHARSIDVSRVVNPLVLKNMLWPITDENQQFPRHLRQLIVNPDTPFRISVPVECVDAVRKHELHDAEVDEGSRRHCASWPLTEHSESL